MKLATLKPLALQSAAVLLGVSALAASVNARSDLDAIIRSAATALNLAEQKHKAGDTKGAARLAVQAERQFEDVFHQHPTHRAALLGGGQAAALAGSAKRAHRWIARLRSATPRADQHPDVLFLLGFASLYADGRPDQAALHLTRARHANPRANAQARDNLLYEAFSAMGRQYLAAHRADPHAAAKQFGAAKEVAKRLRDTRKRAAAMWNQATAYRSGARHADAESIFLELRTQFPFDPRYHLEYALCAGAQNKYKEAAAGYEDAIKHWEQGKRSMGEPQQMRLAYLRLGNCLRYLSESIKDEVKQAEMLARAKRMIRTYIKLEPTASQGHRWLGDILLDVEEKPYEAEPHFRKAHKADPICIESLERLIQIHELYPPPPNDDEDAERKAAAEKAWRAPLEAWKAYIRTSKKKRDAVLKERVRRFGFNGCS